VTEKIEDNTSTNLNKRTLLELDAVIEEILQRNPWFEKEIDKIIKKADK
jgi:hypothetical protein